MSACPVIQCGAKPHFTRNLNLYQFLGVGRSQPDVFTLVGVPILFLFLLFLFWVFSFFLMAAMRRNGPAGRPMAAASFV
jgi:hypothetical protein